AATDALVQRIAADTDALLDPEVCAQMASLDDARRARFFLLLSRARAGISSRAIRVASGGCDASESADCTWGKIPHDHSIRFLDRLSPEGHLTWQVISDRGEKRAIPAIHGPLERVHVRLVRLNDEGSGIFVMVNSGDGQGRRAESVVGIR